MLQRPLPSEHSPYFSKYIEKVPEGELIGLLKSQMERFLGEIKGLTEEQLSFSYAEGKWTLRQVLIHINDVERIFGYRALACLRSDPNSIPGFEQDDYAEITKDSDRSILSLVNEFKALRNANIHLFTNIKEEAWLRMATLSNNKTTARAMAYMIFGHVEHHILLNKQKYLG